MLEVDLQDLSLSIVRPRQRGPVKLLSSGLFLDTFQPAGRSSAGKDQSFQLISCESNCDGVHTATATRHLETIPNKKPPPSQASRPESGQEILSWSFFLRIFVPLETEKELNLCLPYKKNCTKHSHPRIHFTKATAACKLQRSLQVLQTPPAWSRMGCKNVSEGVFIQSRASSLDTVASLITFCLRPQVIRTSMSITRGSIIIRTSAARGRPTWWSWTRIPISTSSGSVPAESRGPCPRTTSCLLPGRHGAGTTAYLHTASWQPTRTAAAATSQRSSCCQRTASTPRIPCCCLRQWGATSSGRRRWRGRCLTPTCWCRSRLSWTATR